MPLINAPSFPACFHVLPTCERGRLRLTADMVVRFAQALEITTDELLGIVELKSNGKRPGGRFSGVSNRSTRYVLTSKRSCWLRFTMRYFFTSRTLVVVVTIPFTAFTLVILAAPSPTCGSTSVPRSMA